MHPPKWCYHCGRTITAQQQWFRKTMCYPCAGRNGLLSPMVRELKTKLAKAREKIQYQKMLNDELRQRLARVKR